MILSEFLALHEDGLHDLLQLLAPIAAVLTGHEDLINADLTLIDDCVLLSSLMFLRDEQV